MCQDDRLFWLTGVFEASSTDVQIAWLLQVLVCKCLAQVHSSDNSGVFQRKRKFLKNPEYKKHVISTVNSGHPLFFRASTCKLLKILECKKYIQYSEKFQGYPVFQGKHKLLKILSVKSIFNTVKNFRATLFFQRKLKLLKNRER